MPGPLPDVVEHDGVVYSSRAGGRARRRRRFVLERRRETVTADGQLTTEQDLIRLDRVDPDVLEREAEAAGLRAASRMEIAATEDYVGSTVVMLRA